MCIYLCKLSLHYFIFFISGDRTHAWVYLSVQVRFHLWGESVLLNESLLTDTDLRLWHVCRTEDVTQGESERVLVRAVVTVLVQYKACLLPFRYWELLVATSVRAWVYGFRMLLCRVLAKNRSLYHKTTPCIRGVPGRMCQTSEECSLR